MRLSLVYMFLRVGGSIPRLWWTPTRTPTAVDGDRLHRGPSLQEAVGQDGPLPPGRVRALGAGLAEGLDAIHVRGLVHRDLKPGNVIMAADGPRIIDFGIARSVDASTAITTTGAVVGTLAYMPPEQIRGEVAGSASDVFSLGSVFGFAATGRPPFGSDSAVSNPTGGSVVSHLFGTHSSPNFTLDVFGQAEKAGQPIILFRTTKSDSAQHWIVSSQGTAANFYAAGRVGAAVAQHYGRIPRVNFPNCYGRTADTVSDPAFEIEYAPDNVASGLRMGVASTAVQGGVVTPQPCGVSARTVWIADTFGSPSTLSNGYIPLINGSDTNFSQPFVLTYPQSGYPTDMPRPRLQVDKITGRSRFAAEPELGTVDGNQLWGADFSTG